MEHATHLVDILDSSGVVIGQKPRDKVDKTKDITHTVFVLLLTPDARLMLSKIPMRTDLPNLYSGTFGFTMATIRRSDETKEQAAQRGLSGELGVSTVDLQCLGEYMLKLPGTIQKFATMYYAISETPQRVSPVDTGGIQMFSFKEMWDLASKQPENLAPTLVNFWQKYGTRLQEEVTEKT